MVKCPKCGWAFDATSVISTVAPFGQTSILTIIDAYNWAYDVGCTGLYKELRRRHPEWVLHKATYKEVSEGLVRPKNYDVVFVWAWLDLQGGEINIWHKVIDKLDNNTSILILAGEKYLDHITTVRRHARKFFFMGANNQKLTEALKRKTKYKTLFPLEYGVDLEHFKPTPFPEVFTVGWIGSRSRPLKRFEMATEACKQGEMMLKVAGHVTSKKFIPHSEMPKFYSAISCLLITSDSEVHPLIYYEALASGRPVVSTLVGDIPQTAREGENGLYLPVDCTIDDVVVKLVELRDNPKLMRRLGKNGRRDVEQNWNWEKIAEKYLHAINEVTGQFSACMLVSRDNAQMERAVRSVVRQNPSDFKAYIDSVKLPDQRKARRILKKAGATVLIQKVSDAEDHHDDVVHSVHRGILEAKHRRVMWCDDDDEIIGDVSPLAKSVGNGIGIVYGNVLQHFANGVERVRHGEPIKTGVDMPNMKGSVVFYNQDVFREIHDNVDHGYYWDYKIGYWVLRAGYLLRHHNQVMSIQNVNPNPSPVRKQFYEGKPTGAGWAEIVAELDKQPLKLGKR